MMILIAGPYRSGTGDDPGKMAENLRRLEAPSHALFKAGHVPMIGEWVALPVWNAAGGASVGDALYEEIFHPVAWTTASLPSSKGVRSDAIAGGRPKKPVVLSAWAVLIVPSGGAMDVPCDRTL